MTKQPMSAACLRAHDVRVCVCEMERGANECVRFLADKKISLE